jgi:hypothetical protein
MKRLRLPAAPSLFALFLVVACQAEAENYSPRDFIKAAPPELFFTDDEMTKEQKDALVKGGFKRVPTFDCSAWGVSEESADRLMLQYCSDSSVTVHVYHNAADKDFVLVAVSSVRSSGRAGELSLFKMMNGSGDFKPLTESDLGALGITGLTENDFLKETERFAVGQAQPVKLSLGEKGELKGELYTWMDSRWETRHQRYEVSFVWDGKRFSKLKRELN